MNGQQVNLCINSKKYWFNTYISFKRWIQLGIIPDTSDYQ